MKTNANRDRPMFFRGERQSEEFARGAWAAGVAVSIAPDETVYQWDNRGENYIERSKRFLDSVKQRGRPISRRAFNRLRGRGQEQLVA